MRTVGMAVCPVILGLGMLLAPAPARASDARVEALTVPRFYIDDYELWQTFPTVLARTNNTVAASLGQSSDSSDNTFGVIASGNKSKYGTFGVWLRGQSPFLAPVSISNQQFDLGWAKEFGRTTVGLRFENARSRDKANDKEKTPAVSPGIFWNTTAFHGGLKFDTRNRDFLEIGGEVRMLSYRDETGATVIEDNAGASWRASGRYWMAVADKIDFVPAVQYQRIDVTHGPETDHVFNSLHAGGAFLFDVNQDNLLILGASTTYTKDKMNDSSVTLLPTLFGALEWEIKSWLTGRVGAQQSMRSTSGGTHDVLDSTFQYGLGVGLHFNNFDVDATLNQDFPFTGGYFISGRQTQGNMFGRLTGVYYF